MYHTTRTHFIEGDRVARRWPALGDQPPAELFRRRREALQRPAMLLQTVGERHGVRLGQYSSQWQYAECLHDTLHVWPALRLGVPALLNDSTQGHVLWVEGKGRSLALHRFTCGRQR